MTIVTVTAKRKTAVVTAVIFAGLGACPENLSVVTDWEPDPQAQYPTVSAEGSGRVVW